MIKLANGDMKEDIFKNTYKLKDSRYSKIGIRHDMTPLENENFKKMKSQADAQSGKYLYRVRGPPGDRRIVKIERREEVVHFMETQQHGPAPAEAGPSVKT